jgi:fructokinase
VSNGSLIAGIELGGTKCICLLARSPDEVVDQVRIDTRDPESTLREIDEVLDRWHREHGFMALGIASFGPLQLDSSAPDFGSIVSTTKPGWSDTPILSRFARFSVPIAIDTDVVGAARAEQRWGSAQALKDFVYITVGTGVGVGAIIGDRSVRGRGHGEMGHLRVPRLTGDDGQGSAPTTAIASKASLVDRRSPSGTGPGRSRKIGRDGQPSSMLWRCWSTTCSFRSSRSAS